MIQPGSLPFGSTAKNQPVEYKAVSIDVAELNARIMFSPLDGELVNTTGGFELIVSRRPRLGRLAMVTIVLAVFGVMFVAATTFFMKLPNANLTPEQVRSWTVLMSAIVGGTMLLVIALPLAVQWRFSRLGPLLRSNRSTGILEITQLKRSVRISEVRSIVSLRGRIPVSRATKQYITGLGVEVRGEPGSNGILWICWGFPTFGQIRRIANSIAAELGVPHHTVTPQKAP